jgi:hypothetical protein
VRYPYQRLLQFLVSRKANVDGAISKYGLPTIAYPWVASCRTELRTTAPFSVKEYLNADDDADLVIKVGFLDWAEQMGFRELWAMQKEFGGGTAPPALDTAVQIFVNPHARTMMGLFLLSETSDQEASEIVSKRFNFQISKESLEIYKRIFWDITQLKRSEWTPFITRLKTGSEQHFLTLGLAAPSHSETLRYIEEEPGLSPNEILTRIMNSAYARYETCLKELDPEMAGAIKWADLTVKAITTLGVHKKAMGGDEAGELTPSEFQNMFSVEIEKVQHVTLAELQGVVAPKTDVPDTGTKKDE